MSEPTHTHGPGDPRKDHAETRDAPAPAEPATAADGTHSHFGEPPTATGPRAPGGDEPVVAPPGFEIIREVGSGGMGVVYEARQLRLNRRVALKVLRSGRGDAKDIIRFLTEAEAVAAVRHPHVVQVYEFGQDQGRPFMVLELLEGGTLGDRLKDGARLDPRAAAELVEKLAGAVQAMHDLGIVHRDLKPSNVLFSEGVPRITDFGLAKRDGGSDLTKTQAVMGTPAYMAPEQAKGDAKFVGPPADIHALGVILYECLTGRRPYDSDDTWAVLQKVIHSEPDAPRRHVPGVPRDLELIALKCLEKDPSARYPSAAALAGDLQAFLAGKPVSVRPAGRGERLVKWARRNPAIAGATAAVALALIAGTAVSLTFAMEARKRGEELGKANADLNTTLSDLTRSRDDLMKSRNALDISMTNVKLRAAESEERGYISDVALAHQLWKANDLVGMRAALDRCPPARRKWEWHFLAGLSRPECEVIETEALPLGLAYSPDGKSLVYQTASGLLVVRDLATGKDRFRIESDRPMANLHASFAFHPSEPLLAFIAGGQVRILNLANGDPRALPKPAAPPPADGDQPGRPIAVGYTPKGQLLVASELRVLPSRVREIRIRDAETARLVVTIPAEKEPDSVMIEFAGAVFSKDGTRFAVAIVDSGIRTGRKNGQPEEFTPYPSTVKVWQIPSGKLLRRVAGGRGLLDQIAFSPDGTTLAFGSGSRVVELDATPVEGLLVRPVAGAQGITIDRNGLVWSGGDGKLIRADDFRHDTSGAERFVLRGCPYGILRLAVSPDGREVAAATGDLARPDGAIVRFNLSALAADSWRYPVNRTRPSLVTALAPDGSRFAASDFNVGGQAAGDFRLAAYSMAGDELYSTKQAGLKFRVVFRPDGGAVILDNERSLASVDPAGKPTIHIDMPANPNVREALPAVLALTPDGKTIVAVSALRLVRDLNFYRAMMASWDATTGKPGTASDVEIPSRVGAEDPRQTVFPTGAAIDRSGSRVAAVFVEISAPPNRTGVVQSGILMVWDLKSGKEIFRQTTRDPLHAVAFDPRGHVVAAGGTSHGVVMGWDINTGKSGLTLTGHTRHILSLAFGPDGRLATGSADRTVKLWELSSQRELLTIDGFGREVTHLLFTPDGQRLIAATGIDLFWALTLSEGVPTDWPPAEVRVFRGPK